MFFRCFFSFFLSFFIISSWGFSEEDFQLKKQHIRQTMEKMFACHVENRKISPLTVRRSFKIYVQQFDPNHIYLTKEEVKPFVSLNDQEIEEIIQNYHQDNHLRYFALNQTIENAIVRHRKIRKEIIKDIFEEERRGKFQVKKWEAHDFAEDVDELRDRIKIHLISEIRAALKRSEIQMPSEQTIRQISTFQESKRIAREEAYLSQKKGIDSHNFVVHVLKAMAKSLDAHSGYYSPKEAYEIRTYLKKEFSGIGIVLTEEFDGIRVSEILQGGPAYRSQKVAVGDVLFGLDDHPIQEKSFDQVMEMMKGKPGSKLILNIKKKGKESLEKVTLVREKITIDNERLSFDTEVFADGVIGKIHLPGFYDNGRKISVEKDLRQALNQLRSQGKIYGLILDLRDNAGGFLSQAIKVSSMFISGGIIVVSKYANGQVSYVRDVNGRHYYSGPLLVLISKASASAAEVVSGTLQDHGVALVIGDERSYGKGSIQYQTLTDETADSFFKVTVGRYYTASGRSPQIVGVKSDIHVPTSVHRREIGERYVPYAISGDQLPGEVFDFLNRTKKGDFRDKSAFTLDYLKPYHSLWRSMLKRLRENSSGRLDRDLNFQLFLKTTENTYSRSNPLQIKPNFSTSNFGVEDLQMQEAVAIIKDMAISN